MTLQASIIKQVVKTRLCKRGLSLENESFFDSMISSKIRGLNEGEFIAIDVCPLGLVKAIKRVAGFGCLNTIDEGAIIISYSELERHFYEQQSTSLEFRE